MHLLAHLITANVYFYVNYVNWFVPVMNYDLKQIGFATKITESLKEMNENQIEIKEK